MKYLRVCWSGVGLCLLGVTGCNMTLLFFYCIYSSNWKNNLFNLNTWSILLIFVVDLTVSISTSSYGSKNQYPLNIWMHFLWKVCKWNYYFRRIVSEQRILFKYLLFYLWNLHWVVNSVGGSYWITDSDSFWSIIHVTKL